MSLLGDSTYLKANHSGELASQPGHWGSTDWQQHPDQRHPRDSTTVTAASAYSLYNGTVMFHTDRELGRPQYLRLVSDNSGGVLRVKVGPATTNPDMGNDAVRDDTYHSDTWGRGPNSVAATSSLSSSPRPRPPDSVGSWAP